MAPMSVQITPTGSRYFLLIDMLPQTYLPPPRRIALFFFRATGEEQITKNGDYRGSIVELVPPLTPEHALPHDAYTRNQQTHSGSDTQPIFAKHTTTLVFIEYRTLSKAIDLGAHNAAVVNRFMDFIQSGPRSPAQ